MEQVESESLTRQELLATLTNDDLLEELEKRAEPSPEAVKASEGAKKKSLVPVFIRISNIEFLYRSLNRKEWRSMVKDQNVAITEAGEDLVQIAEVKEDAKEKMVKAALIWSSFKGRNLPAGAVEVLADAILLESGFGPPDNEPIRM
jgi:hypothetical protein